MNKYVDNLCDVSAPIARRVDSLFCLKVFEGIEVVAGLIKAFHCEKKSELLMHEICYCLGAAESVTRTCSQDQKFPGDADRRRLPLDCDS